MSVGNIGNINQMLLLSAAACMTIHERARSDAHANLLQVDVNAVLVRIVMSQSMASMSRIASHAAHVSEAELVLMKSSS